MVRMRPGQCRAVTVILHGDDASHREAGPMYASTQPHPDPTVRPALSLLPSLAILLLAAFPLNALAAPVQTSLGMVGTPMGWLALEIFVLAYLFVVVAERIHLRKSK